MLPVVQSCGRAVKGRSRVSTVRRISGIRPEGNGEREEGREANGREERGNGGREEDEGGNAPSQTAFELSYTYPPPLPAAVEFVAADLSQIPVSSSIATHCPSSRTFGLRHAKHPLVPVLKQLSQSGLQSTQALAEEEKNVRAAQVMKVPLLRAVVAVTHFVASVERGWRPDRQVTQVPVEAEHEAHEGSQA
jgi:hypothetical protein